MKILSTLLATTIISFNAYAAKTTHLKCSFTEPFITLNIDLLNKKVTATSYNYENPEDPSKPGTITVAEHIMVTEIKSNPYFKNAKVFANNKLIATISYSGQASDGMSDGIYPYDIRWEAMGDNTGACESNLLKIKR